MISLANRRPGPGLRSLKQRELCCCLTPLFAFGTFESRPCQNSSSTLYPVSRSVCRMDPAHTPCATPELADALRIKHIRRPLQGFPVGFGPQVDTADQIVLYVQYEEAV